MAFTVWIQKATDQHHFLFLLGCLSLVLIGIIIRHIYFHPLSGYPGPFLAKFTQYYLYKGVLTKKRTIWQYEMLQRYGSPCRVGPNELIFSDPQSITDIYGQSSQTCLKDPALYGPFSVTGARNVFNVVEKSLHGRQRRLLSNGFAARSLLEREGLFMGKINEYLDITFRPNEGQVIDIGPQTHHLYLDIISYLSFGQSLNTLSGENLQVEEDLHSFEIAVPATAIAPGIKHLPLSYLQNALFGVRRLASFSHSMINDYLQRLSGNDEKEYLKQSLLYRLVTSTDEQSGSSLSQLELEEHAILFLAAGSGTTSTTLMWFLWQVGQLPEIRERLVKEIRAAFPDPAVSPTYAEVSKLPYLQHVTNESLRLWGPLSVNNPRVSPGKVLGGRYIPAGTIVSSSSYTTARDPTVFRQPDVFDPSRWEDATSMMRLMNRPFSTGPRNCIGKHLAEITLALTIARLYQLYDIIPDPSMTKEVMQIKDLGTLKPWEDRLLLVAMPAKTKN